MIVTKYPQSCFHIQKDDQALLVDIGNFATAKFPRDQVKPFDAILITHQHADHIDPDLATWLDGLDVPIYSNQDVAETFPDLHIQVLTDQQTASVAGFTVTARDLPHCKMPDGGEGPPNTGYVIDGHFFHPGDGIAIDDLTVRNLAVPVAGPSVSLLSAVQLARQVQAKTIIPMHYDNPVFFNDPKVLKQRFNECEVVVLEHGQSAELA